MIRLGRRISAGAAWIVTFNNLGIFSAQWARYSDNLWYGIASVVCFAVLILLVVRFHLDVYRLVKVAKVTEGFES